MCVSERFSSVCMRKKAAAFKLVTRKPIIANEKELTDNYRAHSAKLRVIEKL